MPALSVFPGFFCSRGYLHAACFSYVLQSKNIVAYKKIYFKNVFILKYIKRYVSYIFQDTHHISYIYIT